jgi:enamine deaminase RidA (YjgF/YER057c/UK114 family)
VAAQTAAALAELKGRLAEAGTTLERVLRIEAQLVDASDFVEFRHAYAEVFGAHVPARTTIVVGDEHLIEGARVALHAVALAGDAAWDLEVVHPAALPDAVTAEHAVWAVRAGPFVFCSGFAATDHHTGLSVEAPEHAYHGSDAQLQADAIIDTLATVLDAAGTGLDQGLEVQFYEPDLHTFATVDRGWGARVGVPPARSSMGCRGLLVPGAVWLANLLALVPDHGLEKRETRAGIAWHPVDAGKASFSPGILAGSWLFCAGQIPVPDIARPDWVGAPPGLPHHVSDVERQTDYTLQLLRDQLAANEFALDDVVDARVYLVDPRRDFRGFARAWARTFPPTGARPALSVTPSTQADGSSGVMVRGPLVEIQLTSLRGAA